MNSGKFYCFIFVDAAERGNYMGCNQDFKINSDTVLFPASTSPVYKSVSKWQNKEDIPEFLLRHPRLDLVEVDWQIVKKDS